MTRFPFHTWFEHRSLEPVDIPWCHGPRVAHTHRLLQEESIQAGSTIGRQEGLGEKRGLRRGEWRAGRGIFGHQGGRRNMWIGNEHSYCVGPMEVGGGLYVIVTRTYKTYVSQCSPL